MKIKYKNLQLLVRFTNIQKKLKNREQDKDIVPYTPPLKSIVLYTPSI
jgi:hypothetical protein